MDSSSSGIGDYFAARTVAATSDSLPQLPSSLSIVNPRLPAVLDFPSASITLAQLLWIQRLIVGESSVCRCGIREVDVWIGGDDPEAAIFRPMPHSKVHESINTLIKEWAEGYSTLITQEYDDRLSSIAAFHYDFLKIHPFLDGNGRVARALLQQQTRELLNAEISRIFVDKPVQYYESLKKANNGDLKPLIGLIGTYIEVV